jgi:hypothetical protein
MVSDRATFAAVVAEDKGRQPARREGFTPDQQFFIAWGQFRGDAVRPEFAWTMVQGDPHPIAKYRVIGPLSNLTDFQISESLLVQGRLGDGAAGAGALRGLVAPWSRRGDRPKKVAGTGLVGLHPHPYSLHPPQRPDLSPVPRDATMSRSIS